MCQQSDNQIMIVSPNYIYLVHSMRIVYLLNKITWFDSGADINLLFILQAIARVIQGAEFLY